MTLENTLQNLDAQLGQVREILDAAQQRHKLLVIVKQYVDGEAGCHYDTLNPCWDGRDDDAPGKHWGEGDACLYCTARATLAEIGEDE